MKTAQGEMPSRDPVVEELLHIYMDLQLMHNALLQEAAMADYAQPAIEASTGVSMAIVRVISSLKVRGYEFPD